MIIGGDVCKNECVCVCHKKNKCGGNWKRENSSYDAHFNGHKIIPEGWTIGRKEGGLQLQFYAIAVGAFVLVLFLEIIRLFFWGGVCYTTLHIMHHC